MKKKELLEQIEMAKYRIDQNKGNIEWAKKDILKWKKYMKELKKKLNNIKK